MSIEISCMRNVHIFEFIVFIFLRDKLGVFWLHRDVKLMCVVNNKSAVTVEPTQYVDHKQGVNFAFMIQVVKPETSAWQSTKPMVSVQLQFELLRKDWKKPRTVSEPVNINLVMFDVCLFMKVV